MRNNIRRFLLVIHINNLLASKPIRKITIEEVDEIINKYKVNLNKIFPKNLDEFYAVYLNHCLKDKFLSEDELSELKQLKRLLSLNDKVIEKIHAKLAGAIYQRSFEEIIVDGRLDENEKQFISKLQSDLRLSDKIATKISQTTSGQFIKNFLTNVTVDERLTPEEEQEFEAITKSLMVEMQVDDHTKAKLERFKLYWLIENAELPPLEVDINLQKNEKCFFETLTEWYEQRTITKRVNYSGPMARIKIMKGLYYRVGSVSGQRITSDEWKHIDSGIMYLTNKRIVFIGSKKNTNIRLDRILTFTPYSNGIEIEKDAGKSPFLQVEKNVDIFGLVLARLLKES